MQQQHYGNDATRWPHELALDAKVPSFADQALICLPPRRYSGYTTCKLLADASGVAYV
jgi:hypothetical protein